MSSGTLIQRTYASTAAGAEVEYRVLLPPGTTDDPSTTAGLPFILHLHGAHSSSGSLERAQPRYEAAWTSGDLPPAVVACPTTATAGGFYIDHPGGGQWETVIREEFPSVIDDRHGTAPAPRAIHGASMGGYGVLKVAFADPVRWAVAAAMSPVVFPGEGHGAVPAPFVPSVLSELDDAMAGGDPTDVATHAGNTVYGRARANAAAIRAAGSAIAIDVGGADEFGLADGAEFLHALLRELGIVHTFRTVAGGGHMDALADLRAYDAIRDLGRALRPRLG
ncbi:MAG: alpha/beta hydrolase-fold protein [Solirubrobacteraceae bacterium]|nr:alpha/beta hydrolase-fold protein [Patulibacter sp.]